MESKLNYIVKFFSLIFLIFTSLLLQDSKLGNTGMSDYCYVPPFVGSSVKPNILFVMDFSGSMQFPAYVPCNFAGYSSQKVALCGSSTSTYNPTKTYSGYFNPNLCYTYSANAFQEVQCDCSNRIGSTSCISGNLLNWISTTRIDVARMVLTGGRTSQAQGNTSLESEGAEYTINATLAQYNCVFQITATQPDNRRLSISGSQCPINLSNANLKIRPSDPTSIKGIIHDFCDTTDLNGQINEKCQAIMEFMVYASDGRYGEIRTGKTATIASLISAINNELPYLGTPTGEALWEAYDFYMQRNAHKYEANSAYINRNNGNVDPYYDGSGQNAIPVSCRKGFVLLLSDGAWNGNIDPVIPARIMAISDLREDLPGKQNVITYAVYAFGDLDPGTALQGRQSMITTAIFGGFEDLDGNTWPYPFTGIQYPNGSGTCYHLDGTIRTNIQTSNQTYCNSRGVQYPLPQCNPNGSWNELCREWDTAYNSPKDGLPYNFYFADDAESLKNALITAIMDILKRASSGATVATISSRKGFSTLALQPFFYPRYLTQGAEVSWIGFLRAFWLDFKSNLREDTVEPKWLNLKNIVDRIFQLVAKEGEEAQAWYIDNETSCTASSRVNFHQLIPVFESGCLLADRIPQNRNIFVHIGNSTLKNIDEAKNALQSIWNQVKINQGLNILVDDTFTQCLIDYLRGNETISCVNNATDYFTRNLTFDVTPLCSSSGITGTKRWKLGDIIYSSPSVVSNERNNIYHLRYFDSTYREYISSSAYKNRSTFVFVGSNDGMLHAFRVGFFNATNNDTKPIRLIDAFNQYSINLIGREEWAFIPMNAIPYLIWYGHKDYCHIPVVDYRTFIVDASIGGPSDGVKTSQSWRTLLIGVMGFGGKELGDYSSSIFVLDLTDWLSGESNSPTLLWEKTLTDKTLTLSFPAVVRLGDPQKNGEWYLVVGSGPKDPYGSTFSSTPKIYFFDLRNGDLVKEISLPGGFAVGDLYTVDYDNDYKDDVIYFGTYNLTSGNLYRLTLRNPDGSYKSVSDLTANDISLAFSVNRPIFAAPIVSLDKAQNFWIFFGTGRFLREEDKTFGYNNYLVGFKDDCIKGTCSITYNLNSQGMEDRTGSLTNIVVTRTEQICSCSWDGCTLKEVAVDGIYTGTPASIPARGWYHRLENTNDYKELIYSQPFVFGGNIDALVFSVSSDICKIGGETKLMALCYETGVPCAKPSALILQANIGQTLALPSKFSLGPGAPPLGQPFQVSALEKTGTGKYEKVLQTSFGVIMKLSQVEQEASKGKFILWIEK